MTVASRGFERRGRVSHRTDRRAFRSLRRASFRGDRFLRVPARHALTALDVVAVEQIAAVETGSLAESRWNARGKVTIPATATRLNQRKGLT